jgi:hypothetical protein
MTRTNLPTPQDDWLANFADQVLDGKVSDLSAVSMDPELLPLADTILRLKAAFPAEAADPASVKRVQTRIMTHARDEAQRRERWSKFTGSDWFAQRRPRAAVAALLAVLVLAVVAGPALFGGAGTAVTGSAGLGDSLGWILWVLLGALAVGALWLTRKK